ncbi:zinc finger protein 431-like [Branchiostoma floridae]|uniref:Zinc finger protein 431-like n=1 Tax=Branchiostoma floridae TaxID=7739 RepID=A0A9J7MUG5_BRAFL|nr:zinc finger protein 431-like [Branchiostoma floridae]
METMPVTMEMLTEHPPIATPAELAVPYFRLHGVFQDEQMEEYTETFLLRLYRCKACQFNSFLVDNFVSHLNSTHFDTGEKSNGIQENDIGKSAVEDMPGDMLFKDSASENGDSRRGFEKSAPALKRSLSDSALNIPPRKREAPESSLPHSSKRLQTRSKEPKAKVPKPSKATSRVKKTRKAKQKRQVQESWQKDIGRILVVQNTGEGDSHDDSDDDYVGFDEEPSERRQRKPRKPQKRPNYMRKRNPQRGLRHSCNICGLKFCREEEQKLHMQCHCEGEEGFKCIHCEERSKDWRRVYRHMFRAHDVPAPYVCKDCGFKCMKACEHERHLLMHSDARPFKCDECTSAFRYRRNLLQHKKRSCKSSPKEYISQKHFQCPTCLTWFSVEEEQQLHTKCHRKEGKDFKCLHCDHIETEWNKVFRHMYREHNIQGPHVCVICGFNSLKRGDLNRHMSVHTADKPFVCEICGKGFKHKRNKEAHKRDMHSDHPQVRKRTPPDGPRLKCDHCTKTFKDEKILQKHQIVHTDEKRFMCDVCGFATRRKAGLELHMRTHKGDKRFKCEFCDYATVDRSCLRRHRWRHKDENPYKCNWCDYSCIQKQCMDIHVRKKHTGEMYRCDMCDFKTPVRQAFNKHKRAHAESAANMEGHQYPGAPVPSTTNPQEMVSAVNSVETVEGIYNLLYGQQYGQAQALQLTTTPRQHPGHHEHKREEERYVSCD